MAAIRRHAPWLAPLAVAALFVAIGWWLLRGTLPQASAAAAAAAAALQDPYPPLDPVTAGRLNQLRSDAGLDDDTLGVLNLDQSALVDLLADARTWFESNATQLQARRQTLAEQRALVRKHHSRIQMGEDAVGEYNAARTQLAQLEAEYATFVAGCTTGTLDELSEPQATLATRMREQKSLPMPYRTLSLTTEQQGELRKALIRYGQRRSNAATVEEREAARTAFDSELTSAIGAGNIQALGTLRGYLGESSQRLVSAINTVLPTTEGSQH